ncbi:AAA-type ATPase family protein isoform 2 [Hibiscus syriacus]|uniref:AAA-type ATPase family protein isoform 2 n=1 Tax=Hibiscus syriacus TaxID=106335 RepID=A0A6A2Y073_HIBSY|nr:AAA-type ATPase family protein isoform 2 [Hibiscus syriacus]
MHKKSPMLAGRSLMRDLIVLQRSRSLRDPSASPPSWRSPSVIDLLYKKGRLGVEKQTDGRRLSSGATDDRELGEESGWRSNRTDFMGENKEPVMEQDGSSLPPDAISGNSGLKNRKSQKLKGKQAPGIQIRTLSEQLNDLPLDIDDVASSNVNLCGRHIPPEKSRVEPEVAIRGHSSGLNRGRRRKFRGTRRTRAAPSRDVGGQNELAPRTGCGIPFNWSRIHHQGKTFLDIAGRSFSCGPSDSRLRKARAGSHGRNLLPKLDSVNNADHEGISMAGTILMLCQKYFFPKLKDVDIIDTLQWIASREDIEIDKAGIKLLASRSDGSLRDAKMTLEQLSLLGQKISVLLIQELVGLISDEKLVDLLDLALSADTVRRKHCKKFEGDHGNWCGAFSFDVTACYSDY